MQYVVVADTDHAPRFTNDQGYLVPQSTRYEGKAAVDAALRTVGVRLYRRRTLMEAGGRIDLTQAVRMLNKGEAELVYAEL